MKWEKRYNWKEILVLALLVACFSYIADAHLNPLYTVAKHIEDDKDQELQLLKDISAKLSNLKVTIRCED